MQFNDSLVDPLWIKTKLFNMVRSVGGIDWTSYTKTDDVEWYLFGLQPPARRMQRIESRVVCLMPPPGDQAWHGVFTVFDLYQVFLPFIRFEVVSSAPSIPHDIERAAPIRCEEWKVVLMGMRVTRMASGLVVSDTWGVHISSTWLHRWFTRIFKEEPLRYFPRVHPYSSMTARLHVERSVSEHVFF